PASTKGRHACGPIRRPNARPSRGAGRFFAVGCAVRTTYGFVGASLLAKLFTGLVREQARSYSRSLDEVWGKVPIHPGFHPGYMKALLSFQRPRNFQATRSPSPRQEAEWRCCAGGRLVPSEGSGTDSRLAVQE